MSETPSPLLSSLGARLRALRRDRGWSQRELASRAGVSPRFLVQVERGEGNLSLNRLAALAGALEVSLTRMVCGLGHADDPLDRLARAGLDLTPAQLTLEAARLGQTRAPAPAAREKIALVGLRGAGKSTVGRALAAHLGCEFVTLNRLVEARAGMALSEIFEFHGADHYRRLAADALSAALDAPGPAVFEIGGSQVEDHTSYQMLLDRARVIWLTASPETHLRRVREQGDLRPMAGRPDPLGELKQILTSRAPLYARAHERVETETAGPEGAVAAIVGGAG